MKGVLVVAHDAGAAEIIGAYLKTHTKGKHYSVYAAGPAARIFRRERIPFRVIRENKKNIAHIVAKHRDAALALLGTGWMTTIERESLTCAKKAGIRTAVYLESWGDYRTRFGYPAKNWKDTLPDELWVGDRFAWTLAGHYFPGVARRMVRNQYLAGIASRYRKSSKRRDRIVFMSRPAPNTAHMIKELLQHTHYPIRIRLHPAEDPKRFDGLIKQHKGRIEKSREKDLVHDLVRARAVVGPETVAMVASASVHIPTVRICTGTPILPHHIQTATTVARALKILRL